MKKILFISILLCLSLFSKELTLNGYIVPTHDAAGGGYGIDTKKGVYGLCYFWDNEPIVNQLNKLEESGQAVKLSGKQIDKWGLDCNSIRFNNNTTNVNEEILEVSVKLIPSKYQHLAPYPLISIISITDQITIEKVIVNRGNCKGTRSYASRVPRMLKYGQQMKVDLVSGCTVREIKIKTNMGEKTYKLNGN